MQCPLKNGVSCFRDIPSKPLQAGPGWQVRKAFLQPQQKILPETEGTPPIHDLVHEHGINLGP